MNIIAGYPTLEEINMQQPVSFMPTPALPTVREDRKAKEVTETETSSYQQLEHQFDANLNAMWFFMNATPRPCFTQTLLSELHGMIENIVIQNTRSRSTDYLVVASGLPDIYNLGGDLDIFRKYILAGAKEELRRYAYSCVDLVYKSSIGFDQNITTIALVQGQAMGGGFECALSCNVLIAEESATMGFPEILFNLFPGMGAHCFLSRRVSPGIANRIISSGRSYSAGELYEMGIVDVLAKDGEGVVEANNFIKQHRKRRIGNLAMQRARDSLNPISLRDLQHISDIWVEAALQLDERSLRTMARLVSAQDKKSASDNNQAAV
jgi:DSF synthase